MTDLVTRLRDGDDLHSRMEAADRIETLEAENDKFKWQVRDTCARAEKAEAEITRLQRELGNQPRVRMCLPGEE